LHQQGKKDFGKRRNETSDENRLILQSVAISNLNFGGKTDLGIIEKHGIDSKCGER